ncbi:arylamine N-acetyltransferase family protein [Chromobacterium phragmitis]|uniref:hypothetical protein n=1 Tax=Chromobacterium phragmitis TaxID=2202141 RepID=UPI0011AE7ABE|nr:hypothetical protein [Chromobacterium phragmitis]
MFFNLICRAEMHRHHPLRPHLAERVLERLGFSAPPAVDPEGLALVYRQWCRHIPFDNILKRIQTASSSHRPLPGAEPDDFFETWLQVGTGGTCWAGNGALCSLLQALGFPAALGISMMVPSSLAEPAPDMPKHGTVAVVFDSAPPLIVDPTMLHGQPIPLGLSNRPDPLWGGHNRLVAGQWHLDWKPLSRPRVYCRIERLDATSADFAYWHEYSRDLSRFNQGVIIRLARPDRIDGIVKGNRVSRGLNGVETSRPLSRQELLGSLVEEFGISEALAAQLPPDELDAAV